MSLRDLVMRSAKHTPETLAVKGADKSMTYAELDSLANRFARVLIQFGVRRGDCVGIWLEKSTSVVVAMQAALRLGAIYVPLDPLSPAARIRTILRDCSVQVLVTTQRRAEAALVGQDDLQNVISFCVDGTTPELNWNALFTFSDEPIDGPTPADDEVAYILYTSGSTGKPKGVCISNRNALAFIEWAAEMLQARPGDRFANHAPFHFDLSVLDLYVAFHVGAAVFLIPDGISFLPRRLVTFIMQEELTIWYSVPSVLVLMMEQGGLLDAEFLPLRAILFAGEPFPIKHLRRLYERWQAIRFLNLYGPTETNVCTFYEVKEISRDRTQPVPIGCACSGDRVWAQKDDGTIANPGEEGELMVSGPTVMIGYWGQPKRED
ncbi:MAG: AMP-binding protein, partial [Ktedonobacteraceae bacterium]